MSNTNFKFIKVAHCTNPCISHVAYIYQDVNTSKYYLKRFEINHHSDKELFEIDTSLDITEIPLEHSYFTSLDNK